MKKIKYLYINNLFFLLLLAVGAVFLVSYFWEPLFILAEILLGLLILATVADIAMLFSDKNGIEALRNLPEKFSNGDDNEIVISIKNNYYFPVSIQAIDEIPFQFQKRDFLIEHKLGANSSKQLGYTLRPTERGVYEYGRLNVFAKSPIRLISKRYISCENVQIATYPSYIQMRKYDLIAFSNQLQEIGLKKIRRIGHTMEFEQVKEYAQGDDIRSINWKATSKMHQLMVNQYQDEKSQPVYQVIDKGRSMKMPFAGLSLLDYAINSTLAVSNIVIKKNDKAGMFTFSKKVENIIQADRKSSQIHLLNESLYKIETDFHESDFSRLYVDIKFGVKQRSLILLYTNFESMDSLNRQLVFLKSIAKNHLLIVIFFDNSELNRLINKKSTNYKDVYDKTIAEKFAYEKRLIVRELRKHGIQTVLTQPENLTINTINKYLELKARGMI